jgi:hypothetical protein
MKIAFILFMLIGQAHAFTLNNNFGGAFKKSRVKVQVAPNTSCSGTGISIYDLEEMLKPAVDDFWNTVPTSRLRLEPAGFSAPITNIQTGLVCSPTDSECVTDANNANNLIPPVSEIVIACSDNPINFGLNPSNVIAVTIPNNFSGKKIRGAIILINNSSSAFLNLNRADKIAALAHEIGHAIGLGHAKDDEQEALMYYRTVNLRKKLGQDDIDGVSYLYPKQVDGCGLIGSIKDNSSIPPNLWQMLIGLMFVIMLIELRRLFKRPQARPAF